MLLGLSHFLFNSDISDLGLHHIPKTVQRYHFFQSALRVTGRITESFKPFSSHKYPCVLDFHLSKAQPARNLWWLLNIWTGITKHSTKRFDSPTFSWKSRVWFQWGEDHAQIAVSSWCYQPQHSPAQNATYPQLPLVPRTRLSSCPSRCPQSQVLPQKKEMYLWQMEEGEIPPNPPNLQKEHTKQWLKAQKPSVCFDCPKALWFYKQWTTGTQMNTMGKETPHIFFTVVKYRPPRTVWLKYPTSVPTRELLLLASTPKSNKNSKNMHSASVWITLANKLIPQQQGCRRWLQKIKWEVGQGGGTHSTLLLA